MKKIYIISDKFKTAQVMRQRPMDQAGKPNLENMIKNIEDLVRGFNYLSNQLADAKSTNQALRDAGVTITP